MPALRIGAKAPDFALCGTDGSEYTLSSFPDAKAVAVIFSCNHCPYVQAWEGRMIAIQREYAGKGVHLIAINANDDRSYPADSYENMVLRAKEKGFNFPYVRDDDQSVARAYGAERTPEVFLLDAQGMLRYHGRIDDNHESPARVRSHDLRNALDALLAGKQPPVAETPAVGCTIKWK